MKINISFLTLFIFSLILVSCQKPKPEKVVVGELTEYRDPAFGFMINYPKDWKSMGQAGNARIYPSDDIANNFLDPVAGKRTGAEISVLAKRAEAGKTVDDILRDDRTELEGGGTTKITKEEKVTFGGKEGNKVTFETPITNKLSIWGYTIFVTLDTMVFEVGFRAFGDYYDANQDVFAAVEKSFVPPVVIPKTDPRPRPSTQFEKYETPYFSVEYPSNFNFSNPPKGKNEFVIQLGGERLDCTIRFDVFGAEKLTVDKVWEQNKGKYKSKKTGDVMVDGNKAYWADYAGASNIDSRAYFMVKNDKVIRITWNIFTPDKDLYSAAFEKVISSLKLK